MRRRLAETASLAATVAAAVLLAGCAQPSRDCRAARDAICDNAFNPCAADVDPCRDVPPGATNSLVEIGSVPTPADIYVNGEHVGRTPLKRYLWFSSTTNAVTVVAEPLYPGQARQEQRLTVPPLPRSLTFFMNNPPKTEANGEAIQQIRHAGRLNRRDPGP
jgi:hypothetical protein